MTLNLIDIASYQNGINAGSIAGDGVIVKATEGINYINPAYSTQIRQADNAGKLLGVYHFLRTDSDVKSQADYFLTTVKPYIGKAVLFLDFENTTGSTIQTQNGVNLAKQWLDYVYSKTGVRPIIYMSLSVENNLNWSSVVGANYGLWVAQYNNNNLVNGYQPRKIYGATKYWKATALFQYTSSGRLPGWNANLDLNVFYGDKGAWAAYAKSGKTVITPTQPAKPVTQPNWVAENKTYTLKTAVKLRTGTSTNSGVIAVLPAGSEIKTDAAIIINGYRWVRQPRGKGYGYLATGPVGNTLEYVSSGSTLKSTNQVAREVIQGKWGNEPQRSQKLREAGYNPSIIQAEVNRLL